MKNKAHTLLFKDSLSFYRAVEDIALSCSSREDAISVIANAIDNNTNISLQDLLKLKQQL